MFFINCVFFFSFLVLWWHSNGNGVPNLQMMDLLQVHPIVKQIGALLRGCIQRKEIN